jgi:hypothetical protein
MHPQSMNAITAAPRNRGLTSIMGSFPEKAELFHSRPR